MNEPMQFTQSDLDKAFDDGYGLGYNDGLEEGRYESDEAILALENEVDDLKQELIEKENEYGSRKE